MVPWVLKEKREKKEKEKGRGKKGRLEGKEGEVVRGEQSKQEGPEVSEQIKRDKEDGGGDRTFLRYYHLYRKGELESDIEQAGGEVVESGYEKDNWWAIARLK